MWLRLGSGGEAEDVRPVGEVVRTLQAMAKAGFAEKFEGHIGGAGDAADAQRGIDLGGLKNGLVIAHDPVAAFGVEDAAQVVAGGVHATSPVGAVGRSEHDAVVAHGHETAAGKDDVGEILPASPVVALSRAVSIADEVSSTVGDRYQDAVAVGDAV